MRRTFYILAGALLFLAATTALEMLFMHKESTSLGGKLLFFFLLNLNIMALLGLVYFVGGNAVRLIIERRRGILGHKFKTKIVAYFLILISIPMAIMFIVSWGLGTNYIDRFFTPQFRKPLESSIRIAEALYDTERDRALKYAEMAEAGLELPPPYRVYRLRDLPADASEALEAAFAGRAGSEIVSSGKDDTVRAAIPSAGAEGGVVVVETTLSSDFTENLGLIQAAYEDYLTLERWKSPLKMNYILLLGFFTLMVIFSALWMALKIAGWIAEPVRSLAEATEEVASGNLDIRVTPTTEDEMSLLIGSFNRMVREIREGRKSLEQAYVNMENIVKNIRSGVISLDAGGDVLAINSAACAILGISAEDVLGGHYTRILSSTESAELERLISGIVIRTFVELDRELWINVGGRKALLRIYITGIKGSTGEHLGLLVVIDDLTDVFKAQRAMAWQEVARRMAHEIKNPLTPIKLSTERMLKKWQSGDEGFGNVFERSTKTIITEVEGLKKMVDEFSRLGKMPDLNKSPTDVLAVAREVVDLYRSYKDLKITVDAPEKVPLADLDRDQFKRVLINLFDNALEATGKKGAVTLGITPGAANRVRISLADDGAGIPEEDKERLFLPYFSTRKNGTGLGLAIADKIISEHRGSIGVSDNIPRGSVFTIELPLKDTP